MPTTIKYARDEALGSEAVSVQSARGALVVKPGLEMFVQLLLVLRVITTWEQMTVAVCRHLHRSVSEPGLDHLERQFEPAINAAIDAPARIKVPQAVQAGVFRFAICRDYAGGNLRRDKAAVDNIGVALDTADAIGKFAFRASEFPFPKRIHQHRRQRDGALGGSRFKRPHYPVVVGALAHMELVALEIDIGPTKSAQFRSAQAGEDRSQQ